MQRNRIVSALGIVCGLAGFTFATPLTAADAGASGYNKHGNILIADQFNNRVIEVDPKTRAIVWSFGDGSSTAGPTSVVAPNDAERVGALTLISGTGAPAGAEPACPNGCVDNRVMLVNQAGKIVWQYGQAGVTGAGKNQLNAPVQATMSPNGNVFITDQSNQRVILVNKAKHVLRQYGTTGVTGSSFNMLNNPNSAELLEDGDVLIADESNNRVIQVGIESKSVVWQYPATPDTNLLNGPAFASRLPDGNTLIADSGNNRAIEATNGGVVVFSFSTLAMGGNSSPQPTRAVRLRNGLTLIADQFNDRVIKVTEKGKVVFTEGMLNVPGSGPDQLNAPYDAKVIGDYFGLTHP